MRLQVLTPFEARVVETLALTMFPKEGAIGLDANDARVVEYVDRYLTWAPREHAALMRAMFLMFGATAPRTPYARLQWLSGWENSRLYPRRIIFQALRSVLTLAYLADPEVQRRMGISDTEDVLASWRKEYGIRPAAERHREVAFRPHASEVSK